MDTKTYLKQISRLEKNIKNKILEINNIKSIALSVTVSTGTEKVQSSGDKDQIGLVVSRTVDMERDVRKMIDKRDRIVKQIESIENEDQYDTLASVYILQKPLKVVAVEKHVSYKQARRFLDRALVEFEKMYGVEYE